MNDTQCLKDQEIAFSLSHTLSSWSYRPPALWRKWKTRNWQESMHLAKIISEIAELHDHHPNMTIKYGEVILELYSHDVMGITQRDLLFAEALQQRLKENRSLQD
ncbi:MAG: 4a-hydroxytetrahydrobiopterin dehydratase [Betaproteobacteria bacterium]|nr:4a-hydroxytetrahydrobiopterin dehydratase [Betaproteobacteria bacterium]MDE2422725.1 4a-hydroxytetrahydrobiopterin dehydratase [Betaproteobacteria bacterium]